MTNNSPFCFSTDSLQDVCKVFSSNKCSEVYVLDVEKNVIGAISEIDILSKCGSGVNLFSMKIPDFIHKVPIIIDAQMELENCLTVLEHNKVETAPVVDKSGHYCGQISLKDILSDFKE